ncbi:MAG TPA: HNH endonuclease [Dehalococcoidia bacterium]|nr:HNH endonuclease [Dehalococcoidia bacterium]
MNDAERPPIPAELKRRVLVEAGHRCAIPTCRHIDVEVHHIVPWEQCKEHAYENLIALCPNCHSRADKGEIDRKSLRIYKANLRFAIEKFSQFEMDVLFDLYTTPIGKGIPFPVYLSLLIKRLLDAGFVKIVPIGTGVKIGSIKATPDALLITDKGRDFVKSLGIEEIGY